MGDSRNEEANSINDFRIAAECSDWLSLDGMHVARRSGEPDLPAGDGRNVRNPVRDALPDIRLMRRIAGCHGADDARPCHLHVWDRRPLG
jgi:hypothetical protein